MSTKPLENLVKERDAIKLRQEELKQIISERKMALSHGPTSDNSMLIRAIEESKEELRVISPRLQEIVGAIATLQIPKDKLNVSDYEKLIDDIKQKEAKLTVTMSSATEEKKKYYEDFINGLAVKRNALVDAKNRLESGKLERDNDLQTLIAQKQGYISMRNLADKVINDPSSTTKEKNAAITQKEQSEQLLNDINALIEARTGVRKKTYVANMFPQNNYKSDGKSSSNTESSRGVVVSIPPFTVSNIPDSIYANRVGFAPSSVPIKSIKVKAPVNVYTPLPSITVKK